MINKNNLQEYINFLHHRRKGADAPEELLRHWSQIGESDIENELANLYRYWNLSPQQIREYEIEFTSQIGQENVRRGAQSRAQSSLGPAHQSAHAGEARRVIEPDYRYEENAIADRGGKEKKRGKAGVIFLVILLVMALPVIGYYSYKLLNPAGTQGSAHMTVQPVKKDEPAGQGNDSEQQKAEVAKVEIDTAVIVNEEDKRAKIQAITSLLKAEESRDFTAILSHFSPQVDKYWELRRPTKDELYGLYEKTWSKALDISYKNVVVQRISNHLYEMTADYSYYSISDDEYKTFKVKNKYEFDEEGRIVKAYGSAIQ